MHVVIEGRTVALRPEDLLGEGGEARVYRWGEQAVKIYRDLDELAGPDRTLAAQRQARAVAKLERFPRGLPDAVLAPLALARDRSGGRIVGFAMRAVTGAHDLRRLKQPGFCRGTVTHPQVGALFRRLHQVLGRLHGRGVVVGDLNESNVLFSGEEAWLIDADSMQFDGFACPVGHPDTLDPRLYGLDLGDAPRFSAETDWYAFAVLLFQSLLWVHPFGGVHPDHPTPLRRAAAGVSVLRPDVRRPKAALPPEILPDALLEYFEAVFERQARGAMSPALLQLEWRTCVCGLVHARPTCPRCQAQSRPRVQVRRLHGRCSAVRLFATRGRILTATYRGALQVLHAEDGALRREDGSTVLQGEVPLGLRAALSGRTTWLGAGGQLVAVRAEAPVARLACDSAAGEAAFDANATDCYRLADGWLMECASGRRLGQALAGQTFLRVGERMGAGLYRAGRVTVHFVFRCGRPGLRQIDLPPIPGRLLDVAASFDDDRALLEVAWEHGGQARHRLAVVDEDGRLLAFLEGAPDDHPGLRRVGGKLLHGQRILAPSDEGIVALDLDPLARAVHAAALLEDTEPFVSAECALLQGPGGTVLVVHPGEVLQLSLQGA